MIIDERINSINIEACRLGCFSVVWCHLSRLRMYLAVVSMGLNHCCFIPYKMSSKAPVLRALGLN